ncbi:MAG: hypothetical protein V4757_08590 [Pseudomonadota bacterium]
MQPVASQSGAVTFHVPPGRIIPGVNADLKAAAVPTAGQAAPSWQLAVLPAAVPRGEPVHAAAPQTRTLSQWVVQALGRAPSLFRGLLDELTGPRAGISHDRKGEPAPGADADETDSVASDVCTEASGLSRAGRHALSSLDASTSMGYRFSGLPEPNELGVLDELLGEPGASIVKGYASQPGQLPVTSGAADGATGLKKWLAGLKPGDAISVGGLEVEFRGVTRIKGVQYLTVSALRPGKPDGDDSLRHEALCAQQGALPAGEGQVHLPLPGIAASMEDGSRV